MKKIARVLGLLGNQILGWKKKHSGAARVVMAVVGLILVATLVVPRLAFGQTKSSKPAGAPSAGAVPAPMSLVPIVGRAVGFAANPSQRRNRACAYHCRRFLPWSFPRAGDRCFRRPADAFNLDPVASPAWFLAFLPHRQPRPPRKQRSQNAQSLVEIPRKISYWKSKTLWANRGCPKYIAIEF